jgi:hypothetical protein
MPQSQPTATYGLDRVLAVLAAQRRSAAELRLLVALSERDLTLAEASDRLGDRSPEEIAQTARRLAGARLIRYGLSHQRGETVLSITGAGLVSVRPLLSAVSSAA